MLKRFLTYCLLLLPVSTAMADGVDHLGSIREVMAADVDLTSVFHADYNGLLKVQGSLEMMGCGKIVVEDYGGWAGFYGRMFYYYLRGIIKENPLDKEADYYMNEMKRMYYHFY